VFKPHKTTAVIGFTIMMMASLTSAAAPEQALVPGGIFDGRKTTIFKQDEAWYALAAIPLKAKPGTYDFKIQQDDSTRVSKVEVRDKKYQEQRLTIKNKRKVNPSEQDMQRITSERVLKRAAKNHWSDTYPDADLIWPVSGAISSIYGLRRFFNEQERNPHNGLDIAAPEGTDVRAAADGTVIEAGDFFFSGNMVYIDHGQGLISLYAHLSRIDVKPGDVLRRGEILGAVGQTGRVTGAHLHFAVMSNGVLFDPIYLLPKQQPTAQLQ
jgi:murein DD-endopeptidase MepM/ murein hydrolase activator NlpD